MVRVSRRVASAAIGGTVSRTDGDPPCRRIRSEDLGCDRSGSRPFVAPATASSRKKRRGRPIRFRRNDFACSFTLSSEFFSTFPRGTLVRYRNRGVISLGRTSPATFGLRYKAGLLACGRRFRAPPRSPRGSNSLRLLATFQIVLRAQRGHASLVLVTMPCARGRPASTADSFLFVRHYSGTPSWFLLLPIVICLSSRGTLLLPDAMVRILARRLTDRPTSVAYLRFVRLTRSFLPRSVRVSALRRSGWRFVFAGSGARSFETF